MADLHLNSLTSIVIAQICSDAKWMAIFLLFTFAIAPLGQHISIYAESSRQKTVSFWHSSCQGRAQPSSFNLRILESILKYFLPFFERKSTIYNRYSGSSRSTFDVLIPKFLKFLNILKYINFIHYNS